jgi:hypothetical protein
MHRMLLRPYKDEEVDHINGDGLDNRRVNLRTCTHSENMRNRKRLITNTSGYTGVSYSSDMKRKKRWLAQIRVGGGKRIHLGRFYTKEEAAVTYDEAAKKYHKEFARPNKLENEIYPIDIASK